jgi:hypothetical protein
VALVTTSFTDAGVFDTHTATYDWGDGSPVETVPVVQGPGWGYVHGGHVFGSLRAYTVRVTLRDDDGAVSATVEAPVDVGGAGPATPRPVPSLWAASQTKRNGLSLT